MNDQPKSKAELKEKIARLETVEAECLALKAQLAEVEQQASLSAFEAEVGRTLTHSDSFEAMLEGCAQAMVNHLEAVTAQIWRLDSTGEALELGACAGPLEGPDEIGQRMAVGEFGVGLTAQERQPLLTNELLNAAWLAHPEWAAEAGLTAFAGYPLLVDDKLMGVMAMFARQPLPDAYRQTMSLTANTIALAIESRQVQATMAQRANQFEWLTMIESTLSQASDEEEILTAVTFSIDLDRLDCESGLEYLENDPSGEQTSLYPVAIWRDGIIDPDAPGLYKNCSLEQRPLSKLWLASSGTVIFISDTETDPRLDEQMRRYAAQEGIRAIALLPLHSGGQWQGLIKFTWSEPHEFSADEHFYWQRLLEPIAAVVARRRAYLAQQESRNFLDSIIENIPTTLFVKDVQSQEFVRWNRAGERLLGVDQAEVIGKTEHDLFAPPEADFLAAQTQAALESGGLVEVDEQVFQSTASTAGERRFWHTRTMPIAGPDGSPKYLLGIIEDITERKQFEKQLEKRASELEAVAEVSTQASARLEPETLLQTVVDLTKERFELYHAHIYLLDESGQTLELAAGAGEVGRQMVAQGWQIPLQEEHSLVARAARTHVGAIANDVRDAPDFMPNPLLPDTRSELAAPLIAGEQVLGVIDVQSSQLNRFTAEDVRIQTTLAAEIAVALQNARFISQVQEAQQEVNRIYTLSSDMIGTAGFDGYFRRLNPAWEETLGYSLEELLEQPFLEFVHPEDQKTTLEAATKMTEDVSAVSFENRYLCKDGSYKWLSWHSVPYLSDELIYFVVRDVTDRKESEEEFDDLLSEVRRLAAIVENHPDFIGVGTLEGEALYVNPAGLQMMGLPPDHNIRKMTAADFYPPEEAQKMIETGLPQALEHGSWSSESRLMRTHEEPMPVEQTLAINYDADGEPNSFSITMRDIRARKATEAERERLLAEVEAAYRQYVQREWDQYLSQKQQGAWRIAYQTTPETDHASLDDGLAPTQTEALNQGKTRVVSGNGHQDKDHPTQPAIVAPIMLRNQPLGTLSLQDIDPNRQWTEEEIALVQTVSEQLAQTLENLRLFDDTQRRAARERLTREITNKIRAAPDIDSIIQTGLAELAKTLGVSRTYVKLKPEEGPKDDQG